MTPGRPHRRPRTAGFTLIEVMVSIVLASIATSGIVGLYVVETRASGFSRHSTEATVLAQDQLEQLRTSKVTGLASTAGLNEHGKVVTGGLFTRAYTVTSSTGYDDMVVTVQWSEDGEAKIVTIRSRRNQ
ncbi:MAG: prepilin-type N-terminal cleavage/methylation domain-containing protein [Proteobacteria bacterium]|nr:prepilin-type N-terminal cleavage/methylation domain-containing protein [Pseudomonadota bacterium]